MAQTLTWIATGLIAGWVVRIAMKSRDFGLAGDLVTGMLGAVIGGWLVRRFDVVTPNNLPGHIVVATLGATTLLGVLRLLRKIASTGLSPVPEFTLINDLDEHVRRLSKLDRRLLSNVLGPKAPPDPNIAFDRQQSYGERVADRVASFGGSWSFIGIFLTCMVAWMAVNRDMAQPFDAYPYILLNLVLSCVAALQAPVIMMSQNRQSARDRADARSDYEVNLRAEMQIVALHTKIDSAREQEWTRMAEQLRIQNDRLKRIEELLEA